MREIERKYVVSDDRFLKGHPFNIVVQGYLVSADGYSVRVRRTRSGETELPAFLTAKGPYDPQGGRDKFETEISIPMAAALMLKCRWKVVKSRFQIVVDEQIWTVDRFHLANEGLVLAELELAPGQRPGTLPPWCSSEVTRDLRYTNDRLAESPWVEWRGVSE